MDTSSRRWPWPRCRRIEVMLEKPRPRNEFIITRAMARTTLFTCGIIMVAVLLGMLFWWTIDRRADRAPADVFFSTFVFLQFWNMFNAKGFETRHSVFSCLRGCREFFPDPVGHRPGAGAYRRIRRRGFPNRTAGMAGVGCYHRQYVADRCRRRDRPGHRPQALTHPDPTYEEILLLLLAGGGCVRHRIGTNHRQPWEGLSCPGCPGGRFRPLYRPAHLHEGLPHDPSLRLR